MTFRRLVRLLMVASALAGASLVGSAPPVSAECSFLPPLPKVSFAVTHGARDIFVGEVLDDQGAGFRVRVDDVLRGTERVGHVRHFLGVATNWPWGASSNGTPYVACIGLWARPGDVVIILLNARFPGGWINEYDQTWYQPPTTFHTMGIVNGSSREQYGSLGRQKFSLERLRAMLAELPATDTSPISAATPPRAVSPLVVLLAGIVGVVIAERRRRRIR